MSLTGYQREYSLFSPISFARGFLMDLGFAGLIDKFEERFGRLVTNLLLACLLLAVFAWAIEFLVSIYVSGKELWDSGGSDAIRGLWRLILFHMAAIFVSVSILFSIFEWIKKRAKNQIKRSGEDVKSSIEDYTDKKVREVRQVGDALVQEIRSIAKPDNR